MYFLVVFQTEPRFLRTISLHAESRRWFDVRRNQGQELESDGVMTRAHGTGIPKELQDLLFRFKCKRHTCPAPTSTILGLTGSSVKRWATKLDIVAVSCIFFGVTPGIRGGSRAGTPKEGDRGKGKPADVRTKDMRSSGRSRHSYYPSRECQVCHKPQTCKKYVPRTDFDRVARVEAKMEAQSCFCKPTNA